LVLKYIYNAFTDRLDIVDQVPDFVTFDTTNNRVGIGTTAPATALDIDSNSNTQCLRLRGADAPNEYADLFVDANENLVIDTVATGGIDFVEGNTIYVPIGGNIATYVTNATAGDTLVLAAGTYTLTAGVTVNKLLHIRGQGQGITTVTCATDNVTLFNFTTTAGSLLSDMTVSRTGAMTTGEKFAVTGTVNFDLEDIDFINTNTGVGIATASIGWAAGSTITVNIRRCTNTSSGVIPAHPFLRIGTGAETVNMYQCTATESDSTSTTSGQVIDNNGTGVVNLYNCHFSSTSNVAQGVVRNRSAAGTVNIYGGSYSNAQTNAFDVMQSLGTLTLFGVTLVNGKTSGTISYDGTVVTESLTASGNVGIGTTAPLRRLDINEASGNCLRLIYNDADGSAANYADFLVSSSGDLTIDPSGDDILLLAGTNLSFATTTGTKIGTATNQLLGFYGATPVDQPATVSDPSGGGTQDAEARTAINAIIDRLQELGLIA
jgi:hypothetical protein